MRQRRIAAHPLQELPRGQNWTCPCLVESHCPLVSFVFEIYWAFVTKSRMPAHGIIEPVDISGDGIFGLKARLEAGAPDQFRFDRFEQSFHHGIVIAIALATHRNDETVPVEDSLVIIGAILAATIRMMQNTRLWPAQDEGPPQGRKRQIFFQPVTDRPSDDAT